MRIQYLTVLNFIFTKMKRLVKSEADKNTSRASFNAVMMAVKDNISKSFSLLLIFKTIDFQIFKWLAKEQL